ncbi:MAG: hypothetical protein RLZ42_654 [Armatimonadota bacterium]
MSEPTDGQTEPVAAPARRLPSSGLNPDQSCFGCLIWIGILIITFGTWGTVYYFMNPEFHPEKNNPVIKNMGR